MYLVFSIYYGYTLLRLYLQLHSCRSFPPRTFLQQWTQLIYTFSLREAFPSFVYKDKTAMQRGKPLNDIPKRKGTTYRSCLFFY